MIKINYNEDWLVYPAGDETHKQQVHLPYDAMIHQKRIPRLKNGSYVGYYPSGDYWYEKKFLPEESWKNQAVIIEFEGIYMDSHIYLNGEEIGGHIYGYSQFYVELTDHLRFGEENTLQVRAHCSQVPNSRWYPGNGIYRPVWLYVGHPDHLQEEKIHIHTRAIHTPEIQVDIEQEIGEKYDLNFQVRDTEGAEMPIAVEEMKKHCTYGIGIAQAALWSDESPNRYELKITLTSGKIIVDELDIFFGIRQLTWDAVHGMCINGNTVKLRGGCVHHDNGPLGACEYKEAAYRRIRILKEAGYNAIRSSHYPISKYMLEACDTLGMYVMDEAFDSWEEETGLYGYIHHFKEEWEKDLTAMVRKDRNHPCVIIYSIGNEISDTVTPTGVSWCRKLTKICHQLDATIPVTVCPNVMMNVMSKLGVHLSISGDDVPKREDVTDPLEEAKDSKVGGSALINIIVNIAPLLTKFLLNPKNSEAACGPCYNEVDIAGYNYGDAVYEGHHKYCPNRIMVGSETVPPQIYQNWQKVMKSSYVIGDFMWTAWDYLGEVGAGIIDYGKKSGGFTKPYPAVSAYTGAINLIGERDTISYLAGIVWGTYHKPYIAVRPVNRSGEKMIPSGYRHTDAIHSWSWSGCDKKTAQIQVYAPGDYVKLYQDGKLLGTKKLKECVAHFKTLYHPGELKAVAYTADHIVIGEDVLVSAKEEETKLQIRCEKQKLAADGEDLAYVLIEVTDQQGIRKMLSEKQIQITLEGPGELCGLGSGNPRPDESYVGNVFTTYQGSLMAIIRSTGNVGEIHLKATAGPELLAECILGVT